MLACIKYCLQGEPSKQLCYERYVRLQLALRRRRRELLLFCQHPPTLTAGMQARPENLLVSLGQLRERGIAHLRVGRGGDYTAHEPGQCVIYPHVDMRKRGLMVHDIIKAVLEITAETLGQVWGIESFTREGQPGLYRQTDRAKIASMGLMFKGFFTSFGLALNVSNSLATFACIHACGYKGLPICSVENCGGDVQKLSCFVDLWQGRFENWLHLRAVSKTHPVLVC